MRRRLAVGLAFALLVFAALMAPADAAAPFEVPNNLQIGSVLRVAAPCRAPAGGQLVIEWDPMFPHPAYYPRFLPGPTPATIRLEVPSDAPPGRYTLRGTCEQSTTGTELEAIEPREVVLEARSPRRAPAAKATSGDPDFTG
jgi:hypothetical protein